MPTHRPHLSPTAPVLTYLPARGYFLLRPQLLTRLYAVLRTGARHRTYHGANAKVPDSRPGAVSRLRRAVRPHGK